MVVVELIKSHVIFENSPNNPFRLSESTYAKPRFSTVRLISVPVSMMSPS
jgi:hypothetical protein